MSAQIRIRETRDRRPSQLCKGKTHSQRFHALRRPDNCAGRGPFFMTERRYAHVLLCFLITSATSARAETPGTTNFEVECSVSGYHIMPAYVGVDLTFERAGKVLVERNDQGGNFELALLSSGCGLENILPLGTTGRPMSFMSVTARGDMLYDSGFSGTSRFVKQAGKAPVPIAPPSELGDKHWAVTLSDDGTAIVWPVPKGRGEGAAGEQLRVRDLATGNETSIPIQASSRMGFEVFSANVAEDDYVLRDYPNKVLAVDGRGVVKWGPKETTGVESLVTSSNFRRVGDGWVAWSSTGDDGAAHLAWSLATGNGRHDFPLLGFEAVSVSPDGTLIAVSASSSNSLNDKEAVVLLRASDGRELLHQTLPLYSRVKLGFLDDTHLAMNTKDGVDVVLVSASMAPLQADEIPAPIDVEEQTLKYIGGMAKMLGLELEKPKPESKAALVGTWRPVGIGPAAEACSWPEPMLEIHEDGVAYMAGSRSRMGNVEVGKNFIKITERGSERGLEIFTMKDGFYIPSHECMLLKLERSNGPTGRDIAELIDAMGTESPHDAQVEAQKSLIRIGAPVVGDMIRELANADKEIRGGAIVVLAPIGPAARPAIPHVIELLKRESEQQVQIFALGFLIRALEWGEPRDWIADALPVARQYLGRPGEIPGYAAALVGAFKQDGGPALGELRRTLEARRSEPNDSFVPKKTYFAINSICSALGEAGNEYIECRALAKIRK